MRPLLQLVFALRAPMESADSHLISATSSKLFQLIQVWRVPGPTCFAITPDSQRNHLTFHRFIRNATRSCRLGAHVSPLIRPVVGQYRPDGPCHLVGQRNDHHIRWPSLLHLLDPGIRLFRVRDNTACTVNEQRAQIGVAALADPMQLHLATRTCLFRYEPDAGGKLAAGAERFCVAYRGDCRCRRQPPDAGNLADRLDLLVFLFPFAHPSLDRGDLLVQAGQSVPLFAQRVDQCRWQPTATRASTSGIALSSGARPLAMTSPYSVSSPRSALICIVRNFTSCSRVRCSASIACCISVLIATGLLGCCTASQIARASAGSFLLRMLNAFTYSPGISFT